MSPKRAPGEAQKGPPEAPNHRPEAPGAKKAQHLSIFDSPKCPSARQYGTFGGAP